jgi:hypothetical protein
MNALSSKPLPIHIIRFEGRLDANRVLNEPDSLEVEIPDATQMLLRNLSKVTFID